MSLLRIIFPHGWVLGWPRMMTKSWCFIWVIVLQCVVPLDSYTSSFADWRRRQPSPFSGSTAQVPGYFALHSGLICWNGTDLIYVCLISRTLICTYSFWFPYRWIKDWGWSCLPLGTTQMYNAKNMLLEEWALRFFQSSMRHHMDQKKLSAAASSASPCNLCSTALTERNASIVPYILHKPLVTPDFP
jgi:hypothetical protein